ncbi:hypothetical protein EV589_0769 [Mycobacterium sp. BK558]|nr:hypothetical protein EV589_0769 [Mycobacterium sp. BK558]
MSSSSNGARTPDGAVECAGRLAVLALADDLEYWARTVATDGSIGIDDLTRVLDLVRAAATITGHPKKKL